MTTSNRMELLAAISALEALTLVAITITTDIGLCEERGDRLDPRLEAQRLENLG